jgi:hypothetical protein
LETQILIKASFEFKEMVSNAAHDERLNMSEFMRRVLIDYIQSKNEAKNAK